MSLGWVIGGALTTLFAVVAAMLAAMN